MRIKKYSLLIAVLVMTAFLPALSGAQTYNWNNVVIMGGGFVSGIEASPVSQGLIYARTDVGGAYRWNDPTQTWTPLTDMFPMSEGNYLGIESLAPDPTNANIVYAAAGMYLTGNGNGVILSSTNQGASWTVNTIGVAMGGNATGRGMGERLAVDPNLDSILYFGSRNNGLWKSTNSAASWSQVTAFPTDGDANYGLSFVVIDGQGGTSGSASATIFVGVAAAAGSGSNLYESTNGGTSWSEVTGGPTGLFPRHASLGSDGNLWLAYGNDYGPYNVRNVTLSGQIWKYSVSGKTWTNVTPSSNWSGNAGNVSVDAQNAQHAIVSTLDSYAPDKVLATTNGGTSWTVVANPDAGYGGPWSVYNVNGAQYLYFGGTTVGTGPTNWVDALALDPFNSNRAFHGSGEGLFVSTDLEATGAPAAVTWTFDDSGLEETVPLWMPPSINFSSAYGFLSAVGDVSGMRNTSLSSPSAAGMYSNPVFGNCNALDFAETDPNDFVRVGNSGTATSDVAYSTDNGQTWTPWGSAPPGYGTDNEMGSVAVGANGATVVVAPYSGYGSPAWATWGGGAWTTCTGLPSGSVVAADRVTSGLFYATSGTSLYVSTNGGQSFTSVGTTAGGAPRPVFGEAGEVWVAGGGALYRFTGLGSTNTRTQITSVTTCYGVGFGAAASGQTHPAVFIIGTVSGQYGFFRCDDGVGTTWTRINDDSHQYGWLQGNYIGGDENTYGRCYLTTGGRGVIYGSLVAVVTATPTSTTTSTPTATSTPSTTPTRTPTPTATLANTATPSSTFTGTYTPTGTATKTPTGTPSSTASATATPSGTPSRTPTGTSTPTPTWTATKTATVTPTFSWTATPTSSGTPTATLVDTATSTGTPTLTPTTTFSTTPTRSSTATPSFTTTPTSTASVSSTPTPTVTGSPTKTPTGNPTSSSTTTPTSTATSSMTPTNTATPTPSSTATMTPTETATFSATPTPSPTGLSTYTQTPTGTSTGTATWTPTETATFSATPTTTKTPTRTSTTTETSTPTPTATASSTATASPSSTPSATPTASTTPAWSATPTATATLGAGATASLPVLYPNPSRGNDPIESIYLPDVTQTEKVEIKVFTIAFRMVFSQSQTASAYGSTVTFPLKDRDGRNLSNGLYYVVLKMNGRSMVLKLLVLR